MATYTSNLNLYMPDSTDDFGEFREEHNDNMVKIDNAIGGGGGSGGHTIVNPSGTDMPAEGKLQFTGGVTVTDDSVNGKTVVDISGGGGNVYGAFIDPTRSLTSSIAFSNGTPINYTATEDCIVEIYNDSANALEYCVDGLAVYFLASGSYTMPLPLKKGQTLTSVSANSYSGAYHVYGLTQGTNGIFTPIIYSDTERVVGVWRDNKPLYQRSYTASITAGTQWIDTGLDSGDLIVRSEGTLEQNNGQILTLASGDTGAGAGINTFVVGVVTPSKWSCLFRTNNNDARGNLTLTLYYTKGSDSAGSGNWNTDGVPTVHYSTSEQVIGTWENGKPLYRRIFTTNTMNISTSAGALYSGSVAIGDYIPDVDQIFVDIGKTYVNVSGVTRGLISASQEGSVIAVYSIVSRSNCTITFTVDYTKVTD